MCHKQALTEDQMSEAYWLKVVTVIWQEGRIDAAHRRFNCIRQVAPMCTPHLIHASLDPPESTSQTTSRSVQLFLHSSRQRVS